MYLVIKKHIFSKTYLFSIGMFLFRSFMETGMNILSFIIINYLKVINYIFFRIVIKY